MKELKFKTNINCSGCLAKVTPVLNEVCGPDTWRVDLESEDRFLYVRNSDLNPAGIPEALAKAGFVAGIAE